MEEERRRRRRRVEEEEEEKKKKKEEVEGCSGVEGGSLIDGAISIDQ